VLMTDTRLPLEWSAQRAVLGWPLQERLKEIVIEEAYRTIKVSEGKRQITVPMAKAVMRALAVNAARGQLRSQQVFTKLLSETERARKAPIDRIFGRAIDDELTWEQEIERRKALGITGPESMLHPDDVRMISRPVRSRSKAR
jgi:citrate lyase beta subunit